MTVIAEDEARHAALAWRTLVFASASDRRVAPAVAAVLERFPETGEPPPALPAWGLLGGAQRAEVLRRGWRDVIVPAASAMRSRFAVA